MKFLKWSTDGGQKSGVYGFFIFEIKWLFSIVILRFNPGSREAFHSHAFNAYTWWLKGKVMEERLCTDVQATIKQVKLYSPSWKPKYTPRENIHRIVSNGTSWAISFRGPWKDTWQEYRPDTDELVTLTHGRKEISRYNVSKHNK